MTSNPCRNGRSPANPIKKPRLPAGFAALPSAGILIAASVALGGGSGCNDRPVADSLTATGLCAVPTTTRPAPYATQFQFRNDGPTAVFIHKGCIGIDYGISSCASGFRDFLEPAYHCACSCADASCRNSVVCGGCPEPESVTVQPGETAIVAWDGILRTQQDRLNYQCVSTRNIPAGRYRAAIRVYDTAELARADSGGRVVSRDFELPAAHDTVDVPLGVSPRDACDATPESSGPVCNGTEARDVACSLTTSLAIAYDGGLATYYDAATIAPPASYTLTRDFVDPMTTDRQCAAPIPRCSRDARVVTTGDIERALAEPSVAASFRSGLPIYGHDRRPSDGSILVLRRPDGTSVGIGATCTACSEPVAAPLTPQLQALHALFFRLGQQTLKSPECADLRR